MHVNTAELFIPNTEAVYFIIIKNWEKMVVIKS